MLYNISMKEEPMKNIILIIILLFILSCCTVPQEEPEWVDAIFIMDDDGSNVTYLIDGSPGSVQFTPDDLKVIINRGANGIWSMNIDGSEYKALIDTISGGSSFPSIYTDSLGCTKIAFAAGDIYIMDIDGTNLLNLTHTPDVRDRYPHFSPNGDSIVYTTDSDTLITISIIDKNGEDSRIIISNTPSTKLAQVYYYPRFNINGDKIYYKFFGEQKGLYSISTDGTYNTLLFGDYPELYPISMSEDGSKIVFSADSYIHLIYNDGSGIIDLGYGHKPMISKDGTKIVFDGVKVMNSDGSGRKGLDYGRRPRFSFNGLKIVYVGLRQINKKLNKGIVF